MSSLAGKVSMLVDEYNHSKNSPAYRKLLIKYKALKESNKELVRLLTNVFSASIAATNTQEPETDDEEEEEPVIQKQPKSRRNKLRKNVEESVVKEYEDTDNNVSDLCDNLDELNICEEAERNITNVVIKDEPNNKIEVERMTKGTTKGTDEIKETPKQEVVKEPDAIVETETTEVVEEEPDAIVETEEIVEVEETTDAIVETETIEDVEEEPVEIEEEDEIEVVEEDTLVEEQEEEEEAGVYEIEVNGVRYYTTSEQDGIVYAVLEDDDVGDEIGKFVKGKLVLNK